MKQFVNGTIPDPIDVLDELDELLDTIIVF